MNEWMNGWMNGGNIQLFITIKCSSAIDNLHVFEWCTGTNTGCTHLHNCTHALSHK